ncbi:MAG: hypothetical protein J5996_07035 [Prevotella sp.]|nr:hypothetical protein [Prevotella sp.]
MDGGFSFGRLPDSFRCYVRRWPSSFPTAVTAAVSATALIAAVATIRQCRTICRMMALQTQGRAA